MQKIKVGHQTKFQDVCFLSSSHNFSLHFHFRYSTYMTLNRNLASLSCVCILANNVLCRLRTQQKNLFLLLCMFCASKDAPTVLQSMNNNY